MLSRERNFTLILFLFVLFGVVMRLIWASDMEWKYDEIWMFQTAAQYASLGTYPPLGMTSGGGIQNPGLSVWCFIFLGKFLKDPVSMVRGVQVINILSVLGFLLLVWLRDRKNFVLWLMGLALFSVSPLPVLFARKIWAQDILPLFVLVTFVGHFYRERWWGGLLWGFGGALIGQVHMSGFFYGFALLLWTLYYDLRNKQPSSLLFFVFGSCVGVVPMIPWIKYLLSYPGGSEGEGTLALQNVLTLKYYKYWFLDAFGLHQGYSMGQDMYDFFRWPVVLGKPTYLVALCHGLLGGLGVFVGWQSLQRVRARLDDFLHESLAPRVGRPTFYLLFGLLASGGIFTLSGLRLFPHYLIVLFPLIHLWPAKILYKRRRTFVLLLVLQLFVSSSFLTYIHVNEGTPNGGYGRTYQYRLFNPW